MGLYGKDYDICRHGPIAGTVNAESISEPTREFFQAGLGNILRDDPIDGFRRQGPFRECAPEIPYADNPERQSAKHQNKCTTHANGCRDQANWDSMHL